MKRKGKLSLMIFLILPLSICGQISHYSENQIADIIQGLVGGQREVAVESGRVDLVTSGYAYEIEWANKWKESIGQALWYAQQLNKKPGIILILRESQDYKYLIQLNTTLQYANLQDEVRVHVFPHDFEHLLKPKE